MKRLLSQILFIALFVVVPVSFSTDKIPSLDAPCLKTAPLTQTRKITISIIERIVRSNLTVASSSIDKPAVYNSLLISELTGSLKLPQGRAPPFSPFG